MNLLPFRELGEVIAGQHIAAALYDAREEGSPYLTGPADFGETRPTVSKWTKSPKVFARETDVLVTVKGNGVGKCNLGLNASIGRQLMALRPMPDRLDQRYLFFYLRSQEAHLANLSQGATVPGIGKPEILKFEIPVQPLSEQQRIAAILDKADALRRKRQQALQLTEQFLRSTFLDMFGDPVTNPKRWRQVTIGEIADVQGGLQVTTRRCGNPVEVHYLRVANVFRGRLDLAEIKTMRITAAERDRVALRCNDVLVVEGHGNRDEIGRCAVWNGSIEPCVHQNHLIRVRINGEIALPEYMSAYINSPGGRRQLFQSSNTTSGLNTISTSTLKETSVLVPPLSEQNRYVSILRRVDRLSLRLSRVVNLADACFHSLVQRAFRGEL